MPLLAKKNKGEIFEISPTSPGRIWSTTPRSKPEADPGRELTNLSRKADAYASPKGTVVGIDFCIRIRESYSWRNRD